MIVCIFSLLNNPNNYKLICNIPARCLRFICLVMKQTALLNSGSWF